ncbi:MAG: CaiB/BaiF CoA-transferase family protein [Pseudomonadota bacterium]|nr:CaiB/BaiF CoA-transferase family protein [Pseudomonadota bacterium]
MTKRNRGGPLQGVRVVELTKVWAGPYTGKLLAFLGAEVIRVESEKSLDVTRVYGVSDINNAPGFKAVNPEKLSVQIDMKSAEGIQLLLDLVQKSDVLIENLRPGAVQRLGLDYTTVKAVKPDIVYTSMGMYGNEGPLSYQTGYAPCFAALGGVSALVGYENESPAGMNVRYADSTFGAAAALATVAALYHRNETGRGQFVDVSAVEAMSSMIGDALMSFTLNGEIATSTGNRHPDMAPHGVYPCLDNEWICVAVRDDKTWHTLAQQMTSAAGSVEVEMSRFTTLPQRKANEDALDHCLASWTQSQRADELVEKLQQLGIAATKSLNSIELISDVHLWAREFYREVHGPDGQSQSIVGPGWKMSRGATIENAAPSLGQHNDYIFGDVLGLSEAERRALDGRGVIR